LDLLKFERRDIILIVGLFLIVLGITQYVPFHYSALIGILLFFAFKMYVEMRRRSFANAVGDGMCMECGSRVIDKKCPKCDYPQE
jgi:hypothetical protein